MGASFAVVRLRATEEELQPKIDGLSFDEVQLVTLASLIAAVTARLVLRRRGRAGGSAGKPAD